MRSLILAASVAALLLTPAGAVRRYGETAVPTAGTPQQQAAAYVHIMDMRTGRDLISTQWLPALAMDMPEEEKGIFRDFIIIAVAHITLNRGEDAVDLHEDEMPEVLDAEGTSLERVADADQPPALSEFLDRKRRLLKSAPTPELLNAGPPGFRLMMESYMRNLRFYAFRPGRVRECDAGRITIAFAGREHVYETPLPGCDGPKP